MVFKPCDIFECAAVTCETACRETLAIVVDAVLKKSFKVGEYPLVVRCYDFKETVFAEFLQQNNGADLSKVLRELYNDTSGWRVDAIAEDGSIFQGDVDEDKRGVNKCVYEFWFYNIEFEDASASAAAAAAQ